MHNFNNPNELPKEMLYFTYDEFKSFYLLKKILNLDVHGNYSTTVV